jgi:hypothetical protein
VLAKGASRLAGHVISTGRDIANAGPTRTKLKSLLADLPDFAALDMADHFGIG